MPALEPVSGVRIVAAPTAIDGATWSGSDVDVVRFAPDEAFGIGATGCDLDDPDAIIEPEVGFAVALLDEAERAALTAHTEWPIPTEAGVVLQGKVGGVPAKVVVGDPTLLLTQEPYADELRRRLGW